MRTPFSIEESLSFGWRQTRAHSRLLFQILLTLFAINVAHLIVMRVLGQSLVGFLSGVALVVAEVVIGIGLTYVCLKIAKGQGPTYGDVAPPLPLLWQFVAASFITGIIMFVGFLLLIIPGIYFMLRYSLVRFAALEEGMGIVGALHASAKATAGVKWRLLLFLLVIIAINLLGALCFLVGLLITVPVTTIAWAHVYQALHHRTRVEASN